MQAIQYIIMINTSSSKQSNIFSWSIHHHQSSSIYHHDQYIIIKADQYIIMINTSSWSIHHQSSPVYFHDQYIIIKVVQYISMINTSSSKQSNIFLWSIHHHQSSPNTYPNFQRLFIHIYAIFPLMCDLPHFSSSNIFTSLNFLYVQQ